MAHDFSFVEVFAALAAEFGDDPAFIEGDHQVPWSSLAHGVACFGSYLNSRELGVRTPRSDLTNHQSGQDHVAMCMYNSAEYMAVYLGSCAARTAPLNVNYKYTPDELRYLLIDSASKVLVYDSAFSHVVAEAVKDLPEDIALVENAPSGVGPSIDGATLLQECCTTPPANLDSFVAQSSPDDIVLLYTGGTTGMPKGVMWTQKDLFVQALGGRNYRDGGREWDSLDELLEAVRRRRPSRLMPACPFMHGTGLWTALQTLFGGGTVILPQDTTRFDPADALKVIEKNDVATLVIVGDAFFRPIISELTEHRHDVPSLRHIISSGAAIADSNKEALARLLPHVMLKNVVGSSESGPQAEESESDDFAPRPGAVVLSDDRTRLIDATGQETGWLASSGHIPLGYLNDETKTNATFPVVDGVRYSIPGDRVVSLGSGRFRFMGRDSMTINTGGEKVFAEEVEEALKEHPAIEDVLVVGRPSERWGNEIVAVVALRDHAVAHEELLATAARKIARYKLPKSVVVVERVLRSPAGKGDYRWAKTVAEEAR
jgi:fatty-acyl-CoA synthase